MKPYLDDKRDLANDSEKCEVKIRMLLIYFPFCLSTACKCCVTVYEKNKKNTITYLEMLCCTSDSCIFFKIYPYLTTNYPLLGEHMSPQIRAKNDIVNGDGRVRASSMA